MRAGFSCREYAAATGCVPTNASKKLVPAFDWLAAELDADWRRTVARLLETMLGLEAGRQHPRTHPHLRTCGLCLLHSPTKSLIELLESGKAVVPGGLPFASTQPPLPPAPCFPPGHPPPGTRPGR